LQQRHERELAYRVRHEYRDREPEASIAEREQRQRQPEIARVADRERGQVRADREPRGLEHDESRRDDRDEHRHRGEHHAREVRERHREIRQAVEHEARAADVRDQPRDEVEIEAAAGRAPHVADGREAKHGQQHGGDLRDHGGSASRPRTRFERGAPTAPRVRDGDAGGSLPE
jgi:hypothetical protein